MSAQLAPIEVFYSYADADENLRSELDKHLSQLRHDGLIITWHKRQIIAGTDWTKVLDKHLNTASVILLLISSDFVASDYCYGIEMQQAMKKHNAGEARVIPILLRPVDWQSAPFGKLQALPGNGMPITTWRNRDAAFTDVAQGIRTALQDIQRLMMSTPPTTFPRIWNVPFTRNPFFTGREDLLEQLHTKLTIARAAALTQAQAISGLGGIGKTQIAVEYAYRYCDKYRLVLWVRATTTDTLISDFVAIADLLQLSERDEQNQNKIVRAVKQWLSATEGWLLIFDNADDPTIISDFLPSGKAGHILFTTRAQSMGPIAQSIEVEKMGMVEGTLLLLRRTKVLEAEVFLDQVQEEDLAGAEAIAIELDFLPLALDQAGAYVEETGCSLPSYLALYRTHRKDLLQRRGSFPIGHPESVATTWSLSFQKIEQINAVAANLLRLCAFLDPDAITEEFITLGFLEINQASIEWPSGLKDEIRFKETVKELSKCIPADTFQLNEAMEELRKFSLVKRNPGTKTFSIHRLVQAVLKDEMDAEDQRWWAHQALQILYFTFEKDRQRYLSQAQICSTNIEYYELWFFEAFVMMVATAKFLEKNALYELAERLFQRALTIAERVWGSESDAVTACLSLLGHINSVLGRYEQAEALYQRALLIEGQDF